MCGVETAVDDVGACSLAGALVVDVVSCAGASVGESSKTPGGLLLGSHAVCFVVGVLLDVVDLYCGSQHLVLMQLRVLGHLTSGLARRASSVEESSLPVKPLKMESNTWSASPGMIFMASSSAALAQPFLSLTMYSSGTRVKASPRGIISGAGSDRLRVGLANVRGRMERRSDSVGCIVR